MASKNTFTQYSLIESAKVMENFDESIKNKGAYNSGITYTLNDEVTDGGIIYRALETVTNVAPASDPTKWAAVTSNGEFSQNVYTANATLTGAEDRVDLDSSTAITITLPTPALALYKKHRVTIPNIGVSGTHSVVIQGGAAFADGNTSVSLPPGSSLETYVAKRADNSYVWVKI